MSWTELTPEAETKVKRIFEEQEQRMTIDRFAKVLQKRIHDLCKTRNVRVLEAMVDRQGIMIASRKRKNLVRVIVKHQFNALVASVQGDQNDPDKIWQCTECGLKLTTAEKESFLFDYQCSKCAKVAVKDFKNISEEPPKLELIKPNTDVSDVEKKLKEIEP